MASFEIDFGPDAGGTIKFIDREEFNKYLRKQVQEWGKAFANSPGSYPNAFSSVVNNWQTLLNISTQNPDDSIISEIFRQAREFLHSKSLVSTASLEGQKLIKILNETDELGFYGAWQFRLGASIGSIQSGADKGAILYLLLTLGLSVQSLKLSEKSIKATAATLNEESSKFSSDLETKTQILNLQTQDSISAFTAFLADANLKLDALSRQSEIAAEGTRVDFDTFLSTSRDQWNALRSTFETQLAIEAPVKYWKRKAKIHRIKYDDWKELPVIWGIIGVGLLGFFVYFALHSTNGLLADFVAFMRSYDPNFKIHTNEFLKYTLIIVGSSTLFMATLYIWSIRFLLRMMMTEHHLYIDAEARATMAETYLALSKVGVVSETERAVVMSALFKPVTDGIVKDDSMPAMSPAALLSNAMQTNRGPS